MNVLSLFDGISCGRVALERAGIKVDNYFASEIDKNAIKIAKDNYPETIKLGTVIGVTASALPVIDLLIGGSPCQGFSMSGMQLNFSDPRSALFFEYVRLLNEIRAINPNVKFLLENVRMKKEYEDVITSILGVEPHRINSALVSAQTRNRLYWTNIPVGPCPDKKIFARDIINGWTDGTITDEEIHLQLTSLLETSRYRDTFKWNRDTQGRILVNRPDGLKIQRIGRIAEGRHKTEIITCLTQPFVFDGRTIRKVDCVEAERLQTLPDGYTVGVRPSQRYRAIGNGWTVDVVAHIFSGLQKNS